MLNCMIVGLGGFLGSVCRYLIGLIPVREETAFPVKTFAINAAGAFLIGVIAGLIAESVGGYVLDLDGLLVDPADLA